jgi:hypothetical protein
VSKTTIPAGQQTDKPDNRLVTYWLSEQRGKPPVLTSRKAKQESPYRTEVIKPLRAGDTLYAVLAEYHSQEFPADYAVCAELHATNSPARSFDDFTPVTGPDGRAKRVILRSVASKGSRNRDTVYLLWTGEITVTAGYIAYEGTTDRRLQPAETNRFLHIRSVNEGGHVWEDDVAAMDLLKMPSQARYLDTLGWSTHPKARFLREYVQMHAQRLGVGGKRVIGQGPYYLAGEDSPVFVAKSVTFDTDGAIRTDMVSEGINLGRYDITPPSETTPDKISEGIRHLSDALTELAPGYQAIPAGLHGNLFMGPFMAIEYRAFVPVFMQGVKGSGKSRLCARYDAIQSRTMRDILQVKPVLNMGDTSGTGKGPKYRAAKYGGYSITIDDLLKNEQRAYAREHCQETLSNLIRSYESGAGAIGYVDKARNRITDSESGKLWSNPRITSELPVTPDSTFDRIIMLPYLEKEFGSGPFDIQLAEVLSLPESLDSMHHAYSAYVYWAWQNYGAIFGELYDKALDVTSSWRVDSRRADRYASAITGLYAFQRFATGRISARWAELLDERIKTGIAALETCAKQQSNAMLPYDVIFRQRVRELLTAQRIAFPGRPTARDDGSQDSEFTNPYITVALPDETGSGIPEVQLVFPPGINSPTELGMGRAAEKTDRTARLESRTVICGYTRMPKESSGGHADEYAREWTYVIPIDNGMLSLLCRELTSLSRNEDGRIFSPKDVISMLHETGNGKKGKTRIAMNSSGTGVDPTKAAVIIRHGYLFAGSED